MKTANLGFPRIGHNRELKKATENYWKGKISLEELQNSAQDIREKNWKIQKEKNIDYIPSNDFSFYDQTLDMIQLLGATPDRYNTSFSNSLDQYFAMGRGYQKDEIDVPAMEMTKWFDTNYHYIVPEFTKDQNFSLNGDKIFSEYKQAKKIGIETRPVLLGPVTFIALGKEKESGFSKYAHIEKITPIYEQIITKLSELGVKDIQIDEPLLATDLSDEVRNIYKSAYKNISNICNKKSIKLHLTTYFSALEENLETYFSIDAYSYHIDLVRAEEQLQECLKFLPEGKTISLGLINGRNIWINDLEHSLELISKTIEWVSSDRIIIAPSCSLLHSPVDLDGESKISKDIKIWLAFATQKLDELKCLKDIASGNSDSKNDYFLANKNAIELRKTSPLVNNDVVKSRYSALTKDDYERTSDFSLRSKTQQELLNLPKFPTTTIGSFPQTTEVRKTRAAFKKGNITREEYDAFLEKETIFCIKKQEEIDIDVLVHGEFERNDMVEYFGEKLDGFTFTKNGWVQSYGTRCVKPPVIFGDVSRPTAMTVKWSKFAASKTSRHMKGMLTGPVTILQWSFVRDDQPREVTCKQIALAIRDEVADLEEAGINIIQIDEPAIREGLPIRAEYHAEYLQWAVDSFKLSASIAKDSTQIHTHMCYSDFNYIISSVARMDADVISIETSKSQMGLLDAFVNFKYPNEIGPGVYDIHSPRVPNKDEMLTLIQKAAKLIPTERLWVNPDCGLKTRGWPEVEGALKEMVQAAKEIRKAN